jgi:hypothetical protein
MRCLNCHTVMADSDPCCFSCGAERALTVREEEYGRPIPWLGLTLTVVGIVGYVLISRPVHGRAAIQDVTTSAYSWGIAGFFVGLIGDGVRWSRNRRKRLTNGREPAPAVFRTEQQPPLRSADQPTFPTQTLAPAPVVFRVPGQQRLQTAVSWESPPQEGSNPLRGLFIVVWAIVFFFVSALIASMIATAGVGDDEALRKKLVEESAARYGLWAFLGSIVLAVVLGKMGLLPGTRRKK